VCFELLIAEQPEIGVAVMAVPVRAVGGDGGGGRDNRRGCE
jgi:hypothetical protein